MNDFTTSDIAAIVVLYRPDAGVVDNVRATAAQVDRVFAIDNTEQPDDTLVEALRTVPGLSYMALGDNLGIAAALNAGVERARDAGYSWALTMDQDSTPDGGMVTVMASCLSEDTDPETIGILCPTPHQVGAPPPESAPGCSKVLTAMTSGSMLRVAAWIDVGPFLEELFIDRVDAEYCLRLARNGYRVVQSGEAVLKHSVGETRQRRFPYPAFPSNHSPLRRYYITRNRFVVARMYERDFPQYAKFERAHMVRETVKILLYESDKVAKVRMMWRGYRDFKKGVTGRFSG